MKKYDNKSFIEQAIKMHGNKYNYSKINYINARTKVIIICKKHGEFLQNPLDHIKKGSKCPKCSNKRKTTSQFIEQSKKIHKDKFNYSKVEYKNNSTKVIIICKKHGEFLQTPSSHLSGNGCKKCFFESKTSDFENVLNKAKKIHNNKYKYKEIKYKNCYSKLIIICKKHGNFKQYVTTHLAGHGCPKCSGVSKSNTKEFIEKAKKIHNDEYNYSKVEYKNNATKVIICCKKHGEFLQTPNAHLSKNGCKKCDNDKKKLSPDSFIEKSKKIHNNKYNYSKSNYVNLNTSLIIICKNHGEFLQKPKYHLNGAGCLKCKKTILQKDLFLKFKEKACKVHTNKYNYSKVNYINNNTKIDITCKKHGSFLQTPKDHLAGNGCSKCSNRISLLEMKWLDSLNIKKENRQLSLPGLSNYTKVDGYDPETNTVYEFLGSYYHGDPIKYNFDDYNKKLKNTYGELYRRTIQKEIAIRKAGYNYQFIWETDFKKILVLRK